MEKTSASAKERISMVSISITKERNIYFVETKEQSSENFSLFKIIGKTSSCYDNIEMLEDFLIGYLNNNTYRGSVYNVDVNCSVNGAVDITINYSFTSKEDESVIRPDDIIVYKSESDLEDIYAEIMDKVSSLGYKVIIQGEYTKNFVKISAYTEGTGVFNWLSGKTEPIDGNDTEGIKNEILEKLFLADLVLPKNCSKTVLINDRCNYIEISLTNDNKIDDNEKTYGLAYNVLRLDDETKESIFEDFMKQLGY